MPYVFLNPDGSQKLGLLLIVDHPTGVTYSHQCAGQSTELRTLEGFLIPVAGPAKAKLVYEWFWTQFRGNCYPPLVDWTDELISELNALIGQIPCWLTVIDGDDQPRTLLLDEERIDECVEAWIPVITPYGRGVLTAENSD